MLRMIVLAVAAVGLLGPAQAGEPTSTYTKINLKKCKTLSQGEQGASWRCKGLPGFPLYVAEGDLRMMIAYGSRYTDQRAATQTLSAFNTLAEKKGVTTLEWRLEGGEPFAIMCKAVGMSRLEE